MFVSDEIMQKESSPFFAADIITDLKRQFAFLSGKYSLHYICISLSVKLKYYPGTNVIVSEDVFTLGPLKGI